MKLPIYKEEIDWDRAVDDIVHSLEHDYDAANEPILFVFDEIVVGETGDGQPLFNLRTTEEYIGVVFYQYEVATGKKYKFTITREEA